MTIYADNAATTKLSEKALQAMMPFLTEQYGNPSSLYTFGQKAKEAVESSRMRIARCVGADPKEIFFTSGGSESDNQAIMTAADIGSKNGKKHIITDAIEHHAVLHTLKKLEKQGFEVTYLPVGENGVVDPEDVKSAIREDTCLVTVMYANNEIGTIQPVSVIGAICRERGVLFHTDAVQAVGHIPIDVKEQNIDMLSASAHKFRGPKGAGFIYIKKGIRPYVLIEGGAQERGKRAGTENVAGIVGTAQALEDAVASIEENRRIITGKRDRIIKGLSKIPHSALNGDAFKRLPGNINFCFEGIEGESLLLLLDDKGICASSGSACTSGSLDPSHVLLAIGRVHDVAHGSLRLTIDENLTDEEADYIVSAVGDTVEYLRGFSPVWRDLCAGKSKFIL
ncbi:MAG: cysteine desulfurase NifS [Clostridia bacterium]|nr:cysteine desulfurase NifS [Clostridia bacterium]